MTKYLGEAPKFRACYSSGLPLVGGLVYVYEAVTTTPAASYSDGSGSANAAPVVLDSYGECSLWLTAGLWYDIVVTDSTGALTWTARNVSGSVTPSPYFASLMVLATQADLFAALVAPGGTVTGNFVMNFGAQEWAPNVSINSLVSATPIGAAASNNVIVNPGQSPPASTNALLHFDGTNGATTTTDEYGNPVLLNLATLSATQAKFGPSSLSCLNTAAYYATIGSLTGPAAGWTLECWLFNPNNWTGTPFGVYNVSGFGARIILGDNGTTISNLLTQLSTNGSAWTLTSAQVSTSPYMAKNVWHHMALAYDGGTGHLYSYVDGVKVNDDATAAMASISRIKIGADDSDNSINAYADEFRFSNVCQYPGGLTFTPSTIPFTS